jgi:hypothetical protein
MSISQSLADRSARRRLRDVMAQYMPDTLDAIRSSLDIPEMKNPDAYYVITSGDLAKDAVEQGRILCTVEPVDRYAYVSPPISGTPTEYDRYREIEVVTSVYHPHPGWEPLAFMSEPSMVREEQIYTYSEAYCAAMTDAITQRAQCNSAILFLELTSQTASIEPSLHRHGIIATAQCRWVLRAPVQINYGVSP